jgi:hypothetical protein
MNAVEVICPRCGRKYVNPMLYVEQNSCPICGGLYNACELVLVRTAVRALYKAKRPIDHPDTQHPAPRPVPVPIPRARGNRSCPEQIGTGPVPGSTNRGGPETCSSPEAR